MTTKATKQNHAKSTPNEKSNSNIYSKLYKNSPAKKWLDTMTPKKRIGVFCGLIGVLVLAIVLPLAIGANRLSPVATREDFIGKTFAEAKKLADEVGIRYDINNFNGIYDWESEDTQIMNWVTTVYDENDNFVEYDRYTSHGFKLYRGWRISMGTDVKTDKQKADEEACKAKEGYTFTYKDGKVDCHKTQETICKEEGKIWHKSSCKTQEEVDEDIKWDEAHKACKRYGSNGYAKTLTDCYVGSEYKGKVDGSDEPKQEESAQKQEKQQQEATTPTPTPAPAPTSNKPSIDEIADACWLYGRTQGVHLTDYASTDIAQDGNYYQIVMWHNDGSVWKCWYNPSDKDVFIEKTRWEL